MASSPLTNAARRKSEEFWELQYNPSYFCEKKVSIGPVWARLDLAVHHNWKPGQICDLASMTEIIWGGFKSSSDWLVDRERQTSVMIDSWQVRMKPSGQHT